MTAASTMSAAATMAAAVAATMAWEDEHDDDEGR